MNIIRMKLADLRTPEKNVRIHTDKQLHEFKRSVAMFGQIRPLVVDENNTILAGNGLYQTLLQMKADEADVLKMPHLTPNQKKKLMMADNKVFNLGIDDLETFNDFLAELQDDLDIPGFDEEILRSMVADADDVTKQLADYGMLGTEEIQAIQASGERTDANILRNTPGAATPSGGEHGVTPPLSPEKREEDQAAGEVKKFIVCPACGEKVWL